jgi:uncharacterized protein
MALVSSPHLFQNSGIGRILFRERELRTGWRLLIFVSLNLALIRCGNFAFYAVFGNRTIFVILLRQSVDIFSFVLSSWLMGKLEGRTLQDYGLPLPQMFGTRFWQGFLIGLVSITVLLGAMRVLGVFHLNQVALHGAEIWKWAGLFAVGFVVVGVAEEFKFRGYVLYTSSFGIGFWPSAILLSALFAFRHLSNVGGNWIGLLNVGLAGLVFAFLLRRTGNLWLPIGLHAGWDWAQTFLYGAANSGLKLPGHFFDSSFAGSSFLTGGDFGPEGSVLCTLVLIMIWLVGSDWLPEVRYPNPVSSQGSLRRIL